MKKLLLILLCVPLIGCMDSAEEYYNKADDYFENGEYQLSIDNYTKCIRVDPDYVHASIALYRCGAAHNKLGKYQEAIDDYTRSIAVYSDFVLPHYERGFIYLDLGEYKLARADFSRCIRIDPEDMSGYVGRISVDKILGNYTSAAADSRRVREILNSY